MSKTIEERARAVLNGLAFQSMGEQFPATLESVRRSIATALRELREECATEVNIYAAKEDSDILHRAADAIRQVGEPAKARDDVADALQEEVNELRIKLAAAESRAALDASPEEIAESLRGFVSGADTEGGRHNIAAGIRRHLRPRTPLADTRPDEKIRPWVK